MKRADQALAVVLGIGVLVYLVRRYSGSASFGELLTVGAGPFGELPPYELINTPPYNNPSGLTTQQELDAINRWRR